MAGEAVDFFLYAAYLPTCNYYLVTHTCIVHVQLYVKNMSITKAIRPVKL